MYPLGIQAIIAACRWDRDWLNTQFGQLHIRANAGGPLEEVTTPTRVLALAAIIRRVPTPTLATDAELYASAVLAMLNSPEAALYGEPEIEAIINELVIDARAWCQSMGNNLLTLSSDSAYVTLDSIINAAQQEP